MTLQNPGARLRALMADGKTVVAPGCFNAMGARMIERTGFGAAYMSGYGVSACHLGQPDVGLATLTEMADVASKITMSVDIPVICDGDTGHGNAINTMRTVELFIRAGAAAIHLEDQVAPKRCGHVAGKQVIDRDEAAGKIRAAARVRDRLAPEFVIIARCDARGAAGGTLAHTIDRLRAYRDAGADVIFPEGLVSEDEIATVCDSIDAPVLYNRTGVSPNLPRTRLAELGIAIVINPGGAMRAAARAMWDFYAAFAVEDSALEDRLAATIGTHPLADFHAFVGFPEIRKLEEEFLPAEAARKYSDSLGFVP